MKTLRALSISPNHECRIVRRPIGLSLLGARCWCRLAYSRPALHLYTHSMALRLYAATTSAGKLRDFRTAAQAIPSSSSLFRHRRRFPRPKKTATPSWPMRQPRRSTTRDLPPANWSSPMIPAWKWTRSAARPACARPATPPMPVWSTRPMPTTTPTSGTTCCCCKSWTASLPPLRTARYHCSLVAARDGESCADRRRHGRRRHSRSSARHRRFRLRSAVLSARTGQNHGRDRSRNQTHVTAIAAARLRRCCRLLGRLATRSATYSRSKT